MLEKHYVKRVDYAPTLGGFRRPPRARKLKLRTLAPRFALRAENPSKIKRPNRSQWNQLVEWLRELDVLRRGQAA